MNEIKHIEPPKGLAVPPLSYAAQYGGILYVSGIPGNDENGEFPEAFDEQFANVIHNLTRIFSQAGIGFSDVIKTSCLLTSPDLVAPMNKLYASVFGPAPYPARITSVVAALPDPRMLIEIECICRAS